MEIKDEVLFGSNGDRLSTQYNSEIQNFIEIYTRSKLKATFRFEKHETKNNQEFWHRNLQRNEGVSHDDSQNLLFITNSKKGSLNFPGIWSDDVYTKIKESDGTLFPYLEFALDQNLIHFDNMIIFNIVEEKSQEKMDEILLHLFENQFFSSGEINIICTCESSLYLFNYMSKNTFIPLERIGNIIMIDCPIESLHECNSIINDYEKNCVITQLKSRCLNILSKTDKLQFKDSNHCRTLRSELPKIELVSSLREFCFAFIHDRITEKKLLRIRIILLSALILIMIFFFYCFGTQITKLKNNFFK